MLGIRQHLSGRAPTTITRRLIGLSFVLLLSFSSHLGHAEERPAPYNPCGKQEYLYLGFDPTFANGFTPGIPWPAIADLMNTHWTAQELQHNGLYNPAQIERVITWAVSKAEKPESDDKLRGYQSSNSYENYNATGASTSSKEAYEAAASSYHESDWGKAIAGFDRITADKSSPYRAAAAYSAARASLNNGNYHDALARINAIVSDSTLKEFHVAAFTLIGTRAYQTYAPELIAAHYAEIAHILQGPPSLVCHDAIFKAVYSGGGSQSDWNRALGYSGDLDWYLSSAFPNNRDVFVYRERREVLDALADHDPFFDIIKALAAPTPFLTDHNWPAQYNKGHVAIYEKYATDLDRDIKEEVEITAHARKEWQQTKNILWGYVLAQRTSDAADLTNIKNMLDLLPTLPKTDAVDFAKQALFRHFVRHAARIMIMSDQIDNAINFLRQNPIEVERGTSTYRYHQTDAYILLNGGIRYFLEKFDLADARRWAKEVGNLMPETEIDAPLRPLLADSYEEILMGTVPGDGRDPLIKEHHNTIPLEVADFLPSSRLLALADRSALEPEGARTLLASAWLKVYLLKGLAPSLNLLPRVRDRFPGLATDADDILDADGSKAKDRLLTRMLLRTPGFTFRPSWARTGSEHNRQIYLRQGQSMFDIDSNNPSDGNWWCPADIDRIKIEMAYKFYETPIQQGYSRAGLFIDPLVPHLGYEWFYEYPHRPENQQKLLELADKLIAWHPLLKDADLNELTRLSKIKSGPQMLSEKAIDWAKSSNWLSRKLGFDKYLPETLHLAVRSTRYGCRRNGSLAHVSREAFAELHKQYPNSSWTQQTFYWFDSHAGYANEADADPSDIHSPPKQSSSLIARMKDFLRPYWHKLQKAVGR